MLNRIPMGINAMARSVIINHPNAFNCEVYRALEIDLDGDSEVCWMEVGRGFALHDGLDSEDAPRFLIEPEEEAGSPGCFLVQERDVIYLLLGEGETAAKVAYEIVGVEVTENDVAHARAERIEELDLMPGGCYESD